MDFVSKSKLKARILAEAQYRNPKIERVSDAAILYIESLMVDAIERGTLAAVAQHRMGTITLQPPAAAPIAAAKRRRA